MILRLFILTRELRNFNNQLYVFFTFLFCSLPYTLLNGYTVFLDSALRISPNSPPAETYHFWWTSLTYLPFFFFLTALLTITKGSWRVNASRIVILAVLFVFYLTELGEYIPLNLVEPSSAYVNTASNILLTNALNRYHPLVFYASAILLFSVSAVFVEGHPKRQMFKLSNLTQTLTTTGWIIVQVNLIALWMGSWWALQEGTWGGWWNWDSSETFGLLIAISALSMQHSLTSLRHYTDATFKLAALSLIVVFSYFFIQLNFELVSHNFGSKFFFFFNNNLFSLEIIMATLLALHYIKSLNCKLSSATQLCPSGYAPALTPSKIAVRITTAVLVTHWVCWSYRPLFNYFTWNFCGVNVLNAETSLQPVNASLLLVLLIWFTLQPTRTRLLYFAATATSTNWLWPLLVTALARSVFKTTHYLLIAFSLLNITLFDLTSSCWLHQTLYSNFNFALGTLWISDVTFTADAFTWEAAKGEASLTQRLASNWNVFATSNITAINFFSLNFSHGTFQNFYDLGSSYTTVYLDLELPLLPSLCLIFFILVICTVKTTPSATSITF